MEVFAYSAATAFLSWPCSIFFLYAALTDAAELIQPLAEIFDLNFVHSFRTQVRDNVQPGEQLVDGVRNDVRDYVIEHLGAADGVLIALDAVCLGFDSELADHMADSAWGYLHAACRQS